ncbi:hypothetical protein [uncultured Draconibacterium sp.]|nr:hypothetical protein [uncultured Draconibacterium sp.]
MSKLRSPSARKQPKRHTIHTFGQSEAQKAPHHYLILLKTQYH